MRIDECQPNLLAGDAAPLQAGALSRPAKTSARRSEWVLCPRSESVCYQQLVGEASRSPLGHRHFPTVRVHRSAAGVPATRND